MRYDALKVNRVRYR